MRTHVSMDGYLFRTGTRLDTLPNGARLLGYGRHVNPNGSYHGAPRVALYRTPYGCCCV